MLSFSVSVVAVATDQDAFNLQSRQSFFVFSRSKELLNPLPVCKPSNRQAEEDGSDGKRSWPTTIWLEECLGDCPKR